MSKVAIVYWSQTGNTQAMAKALAEAASADVFDVADFSADMVGAYDALAFGCPAMGSEELDPDFEEVWDACVPRLGQRPVALFGSYDWGCGEWMESWVSSAEDAGVNVVGSCIVHLEPEADDLEELTELAGRLAG